MGQSHSVVHYHPSAVSSDQFATDGETSTTTTTTRGIAPQRRHRLPTSKSEDGIVNFAAPDHHHPASDDPSAPRSLSNADQRASSVGPLRNRPGGSKAALAAAANSSTISGFDLAALRGGQQEGGKGDGNDKGNEVMLSDPATADGQESDPNVASHAYGYAYSDDVHLTSLGNQMRPTSGIFRVSIQPTHPIIPELDESEDGAEARTAAARAGPVAEVTPSQGSPPRTDAPLPLHTPTLPQAVDHSRRTSATSVSSSLVSAAATAAAWTASAPSPAPSISKQAPAATAAMAAPQDRGSWASASSAASSASTADGGRTVAPGDPGSPSPATEPSPAPWPTEMGWTSHWEDRRGSDNVGDDSEPSPPLPAPSHSRPVNDAPSSPMRLPVHVDHVGGDGDEEERTETRGAATATATATPPLTPQRSPSGARRPLPPLPRATLMTPGMPSHSRSHTSLLSAAAASSQALEEDEERGQETQEELRNDEPQPSSQHDVPAAGPNAPPSEPLPSVPPSPTASSTRSLRRKPPPAYLADGQDKVEQEAPATPVSPSQRVLWPASQDDAASTASAAASSRERHASPLLIRRSQASGVSAETEALLLHVDRLRSGPALAVDRSALELFAVPEEVPNGSGASPTSPSRRPRALSLLGKLKERVRKASISSSTSILAPGDVTLSATSPTTERGEPPHPPSSPPASPIARLGKLSMSRKERRALAAVGGGKRSVSGPATVHQAQSHKLSVPAASRTSPSNENLSQQQRAVHRQTSSSSLRGNRPRSVRSARSLRSKRSSGSSFARAAPAMTVTATENGSGTTKMLRSGSNSGSWWKAAGGPTSSPLLRSEEGSFATPQPEWHDEDDSSSAPLANKRKAWGAWPRRKSSSTSNANTNGNAAMSMTKSRSQSNDGTSQAASNSTVSLVPLPPATDGAAPPIPRGGSPPLAIIGAEGLVAEPTSLYGNTQSTFSSLAPPPAPAPLPPLRPSRRLNRAASSEATGASPTKPTDTPKLRSEDESGGEAATEGGERIATMATATADRSVTPFLGMAAFVAAPPSPVPSEREREATAHSHPSPSVSQKEPAWTPGVIRRPRPVPGGSQRSVSAPQPSPSPDPDSTLTANTFEGGPDVDTSLSRDVQGARTVVGDATEATMSSSIARPAPTQEEPSRVPYADTAVQASLAALAALERAEAGSDWRAQRARCKLLGVSSTATNGNGGSAFLGPAAARSHRRRSDAGLSASDVSISLSDDFSGSRPRRRSSPYHSRRGAANRTSDEDGISPTQARRKRHGESKRFVSAPVAAAAAAAVTSDDTSPSKSGDDAAELARATAARRAADARLRTSSTSRRKHDRPTLAQQRAWEDLAGLYESGERSALAGNATGPRQSPAGPRPRPPIPSFELAPGVTTHQAQASETADTSATSPPDWDEVIVPAVQKRIEAEAAAARAEAVSSGVVAADTATDAAAAAAEATPDTLGPADRFAPNTPMTLATLSSPLQHHERLANYVRGAAKEGLPEHDGDADDLYALEAKRGGGASAADRSRESGTSRKGGLASSSRRAAGASGTSVSAAAGSRMEASTTRSKRQGGNTTSGSHHRHRSSGTRRSAKKGYSGEDIRAWQAALGLALGQEPETASSGVAVGQPGSNGVTSMG